MESTDRTPAARALAQRRSFDAAPYDAPQLVNALAAFVAADSPAPPAIAVDVDIVVPAYNAARNITETLESLLSQTHNRLRVIVVDDGSTDETASVVEAVAARDARVELIRTVNGGVSSARNTAFAQCRAPYVALCDADDLWEPTKLTRQLAVLQERDAKIAYCGALYYYEDTGLVVPKDFITPEAMPDALWAGCFVTCSAVCFDRKWFAENVGGFDPTLRGSEDWDFFLRATVRGGNIWTAVDLPLVVWRDHSANAQRDQTMMVDSHTRIYRRYQPMMSPRMRRRFLAHYFGPVVLARHPGARSAIARLGLGGLLVAYAQRAWDHLANRRWPQREADDAAPLVSIVLPTYNGARYLADALAGCLAQTHRKLEVVVVVDGSTDETDAVLRRFTDPRLRVVRHEKNRGLPAALNTGLHAARGDFLTWTSDDNYHHPRAIAAMLQRLRNESRCDLLYTDLFLIDADDCVLSRTYRPPPERSVARSDQVGACFLFTRRLFEETGDYDDSLMSVEDYDYWLRATARFASTHVRRALYFYRLHAASLTETDADRVARLTRRIRARHLPAAAYEQETAPDATVSWLTLGKRWDETARRRLNESPANLCAVAWPTLPHGVASRFVTIDFLPPYAAFAVPQALADRLGVTPDAPLAETWRKILVGGGAASISVDSPDQPAATPSTADDFRLGFRMNAYANRTARQEAAGLLTARAAYHAGSLAAKAVLLARHLSGLAHGRLEQCLSKRRLRKIEGVGE